MGFEVDGVTVRESSRQHGAAWQWSSRSSTPIEYEIEWVEGKDVFPYGTRVRPGGLASSAREWISSP